MHKLSENHHWLKRYCKLCLLRVSKYCKRTSMYQCAIVEVLQAVLGAQRFNSQSNNSLHWNLWADDDKTLRYICQLMMITLRWCSDSPKLWICSSKFLCSESELMLKERQFESTGMDGDFQRKQICKWMRKFLRELNQTSERGRAFFKFTILKIFSIGNLEVNISDPIRQMDSLA